MLHGRLLRLAFSKLPGLCLHSPVHFCVHWGRSRLLAALQSFGQCSLMCTVLKHAHAVLMCMF